MAFLNQREKTDDGAAPSKRRISILTDFPDEQLESVVLQWENARPTVLVQFKKDVTEPLQFPGKRPEIPGNTELPKDRPLAIDLPLQDFVDPTTGRLFEKMAVEADILFSVRVFGLLQPEPDLVLPPESLWECRTEALRALSIADEPGIPGLLGT